MIPENRKKIAKLLSLVVIATAIVVIIGWIFDISILKSISPAWVTMKISTAVAFFLSGISLYFIISSQEGEFDKAQIVLSVTSMVIILLMGMFFVSALLKTRTGVEDLFIKESSNAIDTITPGRPAIPTMLNFMLVGIAGLLTLLNVKNLILKLKIIGLMIALVGSVALIGYIINMPFLYYLIEGKSTGMACHTAILFVILGIGFPL